MDYFNNDLHHLASSFQYKQVIFLCFFFTITCTSLQILKIFVVFAVE